MGVTCAGRSVGISIYTPRGAPGSLEGREFPLSGGRLPALAPSVPAPRPCVCPRRPCLSRRPGRTSLLPSAPVALLAEPQPWVARCHHLRHLPHQQAGAAANAASVRVTAVACGLVAGKAAAPRCVVSRHRLLELLGGRKLRFWRLLPALFKGGRDSLEACPLGLGHPSLHPQRSPQGRHCLHSQTFAELTAVWRDIDLCCYHKIKHGVEMKSVDAGGRRTLGSNPDSV